jgi:hypothetical protein
MDRFILCVGLGVLLIQPNCSLDADKNLFVSKNSVFRIKIKLRCVFILIN